MKKLILIIVVATSWLGAVKNKCFNARATLTVSSKWALMKSDSTADLYQQMYLIPYNKAEGTEHSVNAVINVKRIPYNSDISWGDELVYSKNYPGFVVVCDMLDNSNWKSYLWKAKQGNVVYVSLHRIGVNNGLVMEALLSFPLLGDTKNKDMVLLISPNSQKKENLTGVLVNSKDIRNIIDEFNLLCSSMDIDSTAVFQSPFVLKEIPKNATIFRHEDSNNTN